MRWWSAWIAGALGLCALASCWYEIPDPASETATAGSTAAAGASSSSSSPSGAGGLGGAGAAGGAGGSAAASSAGGAGAGAPVLVAGAFTACEDNGYSGYCVGNELLVYDDISRACGNAPSDACILNRCTSEGKVCDIDSRSGCEQHYCMPNGVEEGNYQVCGTDAVAAVGECIDGVAIVPTTATRCELKDCTALFATCLTPPLVLATDCYLVAE